MTVPTETLMRPYDHPSAWRGADLAMRDDWRIVLDADHNRELRRALAHARARGVQVPALRAADFPLPTLAPVIEAMRREVMDGRGFCLVKGLRIDDLSTADAALIYWGVGSHVGSPMAQNAQGEVLGHVTDLGVDFHGDSNVRGYQTKLRLPFHDDNADIVGLLCLQTARSGGLSRLVSSTTLHNVVLERRPDLMEEMAAPWYLDRRGEIPPGKPPYYTSAFFEFLGDRLFCRYNRAYIESAQRLPEVPRLTSRQVEALDLMDSLCHDPALHLEMPLERGDMQFVNNYTVLHSRSRYEDWPEPERRRYLLRLWLETGLVPALPASWAERHEDWKDWQLDPRPPIFDLSVRRAALEH
ncbi:MAG: TauD/TfdA family dioxygenase [Burkholderiales bacterium]